MKKKQTKEFVCSSCGKSYARWAGKCESCGEWNTIQEILQGDKFHGSVSPKKLNRSYRKAEPITEVAVEDAGRFSSGLSELDIVLGGGVVPGSLVLIGGEPGVGKSTLLLEISKELCQRGMRVLYVSGEESPRQIRIRAERMDTLSENLLLSSETVVENLGEMIEEENPSIVLIDSIQTVSREYLPNQAGTVVQLRECTQFLMETSKRTGIPIFLVGHITKEGAIAGPKILEHLVDTVLYFEGDKLHFYRMLRAVKNRFGPVGDLAIFEMHAKGLREVQDKKQMFLDLEKVHRPGTVITSVLEGSRALSVEVQALVSRTAYSQARRMAEGLDNRRLILISAVIEKYIGLKLSECDIFSNLAGGLSVDEPSLDLAICASIVSSYLEKPFRSGLSILGEVGLSGEVRSVSQVNSRIRELLGIGMERIVIPSGNMSEIGEEDWKKKVIPVASIQELQKLLVD